MTTFKINAQIDPSGAVTGAIRVNRSLDNMRRKSNSATRALKNFGNLLVAGAFTRFAVGAIAAADSTQDFRNRLLALGEDAQSVNLTLDSLRQTANETTQWRAG